MAIDYAKLYKAVAKATSVDVSFGNSTTAPILWMSTGLPLLDLAMGGGLARGRITHICGDSSTGKSVVGLWLAKRHQAACPVGTVIYIDTEHAIGSDFCRKVGVDMDRMAVARPDTVEETFAFVDAVIVAVTKDIPGENVLIIWDSLAATVSGAEAKGEYDSAGQPGRLAAACSRGLKKLRPVIARSGATFVIINQLRMDIGVMYGEKAKPAGGKAPRYYSDSSLRLRQVELLKTSKEADPFGIRVEAFVDKSRVSIPFRRASFKILYTIGQLSDTGEVYDALKKYNLATYRGGAVHVGDREFDSKAIFEATLLKEPEYFTALINRLREAMDSCVMPPAPEDLDDTPPEPVPDTDDLPEA